jgi:hypothetical protein
MSFVILKINILLQYVEHSYVVGGCIYNQYSLELSFLWAQSLFVELPVWTFEEDSNFEGGNSCFFLTFDTWLPHYMAIGKWPTWRTVLFYVFIFIFSSLHVSNTSCSSSGETNCVNTTSGSCHSVSVAVSCAGRKWTSDKTRPPTQSDSYQRLY